MSGWYLYGFQGQEMDDEIKGEGNSVNYKYRMHDPRIGRFFAVDPLAAKYPQWSPYAFSGNQVIHTTELEGLEPQVDLNGNLAGYKIINGDGPTQIASFLNDSKNKEKYGYSLLTTVTWEDVVSGDIEAFTDPNIENPSDKTDKGYESLNLEVGDMLSLSWIIKKNKNYIERINKIPEAESKVHKIEKELSNLNSKRNGLVSRRKAIYDRIDIKNKLYKALSQFDDKIADGGLGGNAGLGMEIQRENGRKLGRLSGEISRTETSIKNKKDELETAKSDLETTKEIYGKED